MIFPCQIKGDHTDVYSAVARVAYLASDHIISVQPTLATESPFSSLLRTYSSKKYPGVTSTTAPEVGR